MIFDNYDILKKLLQDDMPEFCNDDLYKLPSRKCITYLDEFQKNFKSNKQRKALCLVSFTSLRSHYIKEIEKKWLNEIRVKYGFPKGFPIHFTALRTICQKLNYKSNDGLIAFESDGWNDDIAMKKAMQVIDPESWSFKGANKKARSFIEQFETWKIFRKENSDGFGELDKEKIKSFYNDLFSSLKTVDFDILCTSVFYDLSASHRKDPVINKNQIKGPELNAFSEHLNLLCFYLKHGFLSTQERENKGSLYKHGFSTKLRCDGDDGFNSKSEYRFVFNDAMTSGTSHFRSETVRNCLDEIRFINKSEIGHYDDLENQTLVSHIGCDIIDFITYYVGMHSIKDLIIQDFLDLGLSESDANEEFLSNVTFKIDDTLYDPFNSIFKDKLKSSSTHKSIQLIPECSYFKW